MTDLNSNKYLFQQRNGTYYPISTNDNIKGGTLPEDEPTTTMGASNNLFHAIKDTGEGLAAVAVEHGG